MSKVIKWICIAAGALAALGIILIIVGSTLGGKLNWYLRVDDFAAATVDAQEMVSDAKTLDAFTAIDAQTSSIDLIVEEGDSYKVEYQTYKVHEPVIEVFDGTLEITVPQNTIQFSVGLTPTEEEYIKVTVPTDDTEYDVAIKSASGRTDIKDINIKGSVQTASGEVNINNTKTSDDLKLDISSGDVSVTDIVAGRLNVKVLSGSVNISNGEFDNVECEVASGEVYFENVTTTEWESSASSGSIHCVGLTADDVNHKGASGELVLDEGVIQSMDCDISSGDVYAEGIVIDNLNVKALSGSFEMSIEGAQSDYGYNLKSLAGDISCGNMDFEGSLIVDSEKDKQIKVDLSSGDVTITFSK